MLPNNGGNLGGYSGAALWGSCPAIDLIRRLVFVATGNFYTGPANVTECQEAQNNRTTKPTQPDQCIGPDINFNSILALEIDMGKLHGLGNLGDMISFISLVWSLTTLIAHQLAGPGGLEGGGQWGAARDGMTVNTNIANSNRERFTLALSNQTTTAGAWVALDGESGQILWSTANPSNDTVHGPVMVVNDLHFAGSVAPNGPVYAMDTRTGNILYGCIYFGNGYSVGLAARFHPTLASGTSLYAFCVV
ncbi:hypothetical protein P3X46_002968 [Hevea brasiliensis]|uniref:Bulb-type lectin domain-containing protein n=1 Tax=Hevea brasiliensis TaxID=3981 RepID=A0ABQ9N842_HEVBR|nr:hypothetical protein P3X46_002968 [Hevea brasiliensis]